MGSRRADRPRSRSRARPRGGTPARGVVLALSVATVAAGAGVTIVAGEGRSGPADRVTANATDTAGNTAGDTTGGTTGEVAGGASLPSPPAPRTSGSAPAGAGGSAEPGRSAAPSASASTSVSAPAGETARAGTTGSTGSTGSTGTGSEGTAGPGGEESAPRDSGTGAAPDDGAAGDGGPEARVLALVNEERDTAGCRPVTADARLTRAADDYSDVMAASGVMSHTGPDGSTMADRVEAAGYTWPNLGENMARGQPDAASAMDAWMNSPGHRANILDCSFEELGVGVHFGDGGPWWTQNFGTSRQDLSDK